VTNNISKRINALIQELGLNKSSFSKEIGIDNNVTIGRIVNEDRSPSFEVLNKILNRFPNINAGWLLTGEGNMLRDAPAESPPASVPDTPGPPCAELLAEARAEVARLHERLAECQGQVSRLIERL